MTTSARRPDAEFDALTAKITRDRGFGCASYKEKCLRRRIAVRMRARGVHTYRDYARVLDADTHEYDRLLDALTINVTRFFRNPEAWAALDGKVLAPLMAEGKGPLRVWSAGCASGEEAFTLAILLQRRAATAGRRARRVEILGTDIDKASLDAAAVARYPEAAFADTPADIRAACFPGGAPFVVPEAARALVRFARHDLLADGAPGGPFDLIVCRNVAIYFDKRSQEALWDLFHDALVPGGVLMQGKVETLPASQRARFEVVDARERLFRRMP
jgi:chemotaxis methyl-accepting protein methylase